MKASEGGDENYLKHLSSVLGIKRILAFSDILIYTCHNVKYRVEAKNKVFKLHFDVRDFCINTCF